MFRARTAIRTAAALGPAARAGAAGARATAAATASVAGARATATAGNNGLRRFIADAVEAETYNVVGEVLGSGDVGRDPTPGGTAASIVHKIVVATFRSTHTPAECHLALRTAGLAPGSATRVMTGDVPDVTTAIQIASRVPAPEQPRTRHALIEACRQKQESEQAVARADAKLKASQARLAELEAEIAEGKR